MLWSNFAIIALSVINQFAKALDVGLSWRCSRNRVFGTNAGDWHLERNL